jgi:hypothetical protein
MNRSAAVNKTINRLNARATLSSLIIFESFAVGILTLFLYAALVRHADWKGVIVGVFLCFVVYLWWQSFSVEIDEVELRYRSLFSKQRVIARRQITRAVRKVELVSQGNRPPNRIEIQGVVDGQDVSFDINAKPFSRSDVQAMEQILQVI